MENILAESRSLWDIVFTSLFQGVKFSVTRNELELYIAQEHVQIIGWRHSLKKNTQLLNKH